MENQILLAKDVSYPFPKEMQTTHHTIRTHALIVLAELHLVAYQYSSTFSLNSRSLKLSKK